MARLLISTQRWDFDAFFDAAERGGVGLEVQTFANPDVLDGDWKKTVDDYRRRFAGWPKGNVSLHGAFYDTFPNTPDKRLQSVVRDRYLASLEAAAMLRARVVVFHAHYNPMIRHRNYIKTWVERQADFWREMVAFAEKENIVIAMENTWEPDPSMIQSLLRAVPSSAFKACLDVGHAYLSSKLSIEEWARLLGDDLVHIHLHNNHGELDEHLSPATGHLQFDGFFKVLDAMKAPPQVTIEVHEERAAEEGVALVRRLSARKEYA